LKYAFKELEKEGKRRKAIVVLTDGLDTHFATPIAARLRKRKRTKKHCATIDPHSSAD
jgi:hypothetical protein